MQNCTPLWRVEVKMCKTHQRQTTFGSCDIEKVYAVVARSVKIYKTLQLRSPLGMEMFKRCTPLWPEAHFEVKKCKKLAVSVRFLKLGSSFSWQAQGPAASQK
jgi:hypothetical protein